MSRKDVENVMSYKGGRIDARGTIANLGAAVSSRMDPTKNFGRTKLVVARNAVDIRAALGRHQQKNPGWKSANSAHRIAAWRDFNALRGEAATISKAQPSITYGQALIAAEKVRADKERKAREAKRNSGRKK